MFFVKCQCFRPLDDTDSILLQSIQQLRCLIWLIWLVSYIMLPLWFVSWCQSVRVSFLTDIFVQLYLEVWWILQLINSHLSYLLTNSTLFWNKFRTFFWLFSTYLRVKISWENQTLSQGRESVRRVVNNSSENI